MAKQSGDGEKAGDKGGRSEQSHDADAKSRPPAGPHARDDLTNHDATPGAGALPSDKRDGEVDGGTG